MVRERAQDNPDIPLSAAQERAEVSKDVLKSKAQENKRLAKLEKAMKAQEGGKDKRGFFARHPILTAVGLGAAAYFGTPYLAKWFAGNERAGARAGIDWLSRFNNSAKKLAPPGAPRGADLGGATTGYGFEI